MGKRASLMSLTLVATIAIGLLRPSIAENQTPPVGIGNGAKFALLGDGPLPNLTKNLLTMGTNCVLSGVDASIGTAYEDVSIGARTTIGGTIAASNFDFYPPPANIALGGQTVVKGQCVTDGGKVTGSGKCKGGIDGTGNNPYILDPNGYVGSAVNQEECVDANVLCQDLTQAVTINLPPNGKMTLTATSTPSGITVFQAPDIILASLATLTLKGNATDKIILRTPGSISLGPSSKIVLAGGITAANVMISATTPPRDDPGSDPLSRSWIKTGAGVTINGEVHAENGCYYGANNTVNGAIVCDWAFQVGNGLHLNHVPMTLTMPHCSTGEDDQKCFGNDDL